MKKTFIVFIAIILCISLASCTTFEKRGLENFSVYHSLTEITLKLLPSETFLLDYEYGFGDYYYIEKSDNFFWGYEKAIVYLSYSSEEYAKAKAYCINTFILSETNRCEYKGFVFIENNLQISGEYPKYFNMFGFNDDKNTLIFIGYFNAEKNDERSQLAVTDFGAFLENNFSEYYDFGN